MVGPSGGSLCCASLGLGGQKGAGDVVLGLRPHHDVRDFQGPAHLGGRRPDPDDHAHGPVFELFGRGLGRLEIFEEARFSEIDFGLQVLGAALPMLSARAPFFFQVVAAPVFAVGQDLARNLLLHFRFRIFEMLLDSRVDFQRNGGAFWVSGFRVWGGLPQNRQVAFRHPGGGACQSFDGQDGAAIQAPLCPRQCWLEFAFLLAVLSSGVGISVVRARVLCVGAALAARSLWRHRA